MTTHTLTPVDDSSLISADGYNPDLQVLSIKFRSTGEVYEYQGVDPTTYQEYAGAESKGKFFSRVIKANIIGRKVQQAGA